VRGVAIEVREINVTRIFYKSGQTRDTKTHDDSLLGTEGVEIMLKKPTTKGVGSYRSSLCVGRFGPVKSFCLSIEVHFYKK
jgi:hypothetical protein